ncbi:MAG: hypothetical protein ACT4QA_06290 [Panacagrimonas sp.]
MPTEAVIVFVHNPNRQSTLYSIIVRNLSGDMLGRKTGMLGPRQGASLRYNPPGATTSTARLSIHVEVRGGTGLPVAASVEKITKSNNLTSVAFTPSVVPPVPSLRSHAAIGLAPGQRIGVTLFDERNAGLPASQFRIEIRSLAGAVLTQLTGMTTPGSGAAVSWGSGDPGFPTTMLNPRMDLHVDAYVADAAKVSNSLEIFESSSRRTVVTGLANSYNFFAACPDD